MFESYKYLQKLLEPLTDKYNQTGAVESYHVREFMKRGMSIEAIAIVSEIPQKVIEEALARKSG